VPSPAMPAAAQACGLVMPACINAAETVFALRRVQLRNRFGNAADASPVSAPTVKRPPIPRGRFEIRNLTCLASATSFLSDRTGGAPLVFGQRAQNKESVLRLDAILLDFDLVVAIHAVARKKACDIGGHVNRVREHRWPNSALKSRESGSPLLGIDQYAARVVVGEKKAHARFHPPVLIHWLFFPCPATPRPWCDRDSSPGQ